MIKKSTIQKMFFSLLFNLNTLGLPFGVMWTNVLSPLMLIHIFLKRQFTYVIISFLCILGYVLLQYNSMQIPKFQDFLLGTIYFFTSILVAIYFYIYFNDDKTKHDDTLISIIKGNIVLTFIALILYIVPFFKDIFWHVSKNINSFGEVRLQLFFYEPSHLSFVFSFFLSYLLLNVLFFPEKKYLKFLIFTLISIYLTKSLGTMATMVISIIIGFMIFFIPLIRIFYKKIALITIISIIVIPLVSESLISRIDKFTDGKDNSGNVRLIYATSSAYDMIEKYNYLFGVGFGQTKVYVKEFTSKIHGYGTDNLPNSFASTLATVGIIGISLKFFFLFFLFFKKRIYSNIFKLISFFYLLLYGFVGGWMLNVYEFIFLAIIFSNSFSEFDKNNIFKRFK